MRVKITILVFIAAHNLDYLHWVSTLTVNLCQRYLLQIGSLIQSWRYVLRGTLIIYQYLDHLVARNQELHKHVLKQLPQPFILFLFLRKYVFFYNAGRIHSVTIDNSTFGRVEEFNTRSAIGASLPESANGNKPHGVQFDRRVVYCLLIYITLSGEGKYFKIII